MKFATAFQESGGEYSMRRILAFLFGLVSCGAGITALAVGSGWQVVACAFGVPGAIALVLLLFTTWGDVASAIGKVRGRNG